MEGSFRFRLRLPCFFWGIPRSHRVLGFRVLGLGFRVPATQHGFQKLMDSDQAPIAARLLIFNTFITSKWAWAAPTMLPGKVVLKRLEAAKNTFLLSCLHGLKTRCPEGEPLKSSVARTEDLIGEKSG